MNSTAFQVFKQVALLAFPPQCFDTYFLELNYLDVPCFKATLSKGLGLGIILGSILVKVPQIAKILKNKSGTGINLYSVSLDLTAITIYMSYNFVNGFPFSSWGDTMFLAIQTVLIGVLVLWFGGAKASGILYLVSYLGICYILMGGTTPRSILTTLTSINIPIIASGKVLQAITNYKNGHTGQLAAATLFMLLAGSVARIFTSIQETGDMLNIVTYVVSSAANALLVFQLLYYWNVNVPNPGPKKVSNKKGKKSN